MVLRILLTRELEDFSVYLLNLFICLPAHSMEEAEALCDRLGIFVDGSLQCIGNPKEVNLKKHMYC